MSIATYYAFILECRVCKDSVQVGPTQENEESRSHKQMTWYYHPETKQLMGLSEGTGDTFECLPCHAVKWAEEFPEEQE